MNVNTTAGEKLQAVGCFKLNDDLAVPLIESAKQKRPDFFSAPYGYRSNIGASRFIHAVVIPEVLDGRSPDLEAIPDRDRDPFEDESYHMIDIALDDLRVSMLQDHFRASEFGDTLDAHLRRVIQFHLQE